MIKKYFAVSFICLSLCACVASKSVKEDFRTETYNQRTALFAQNPLREGQMVFFGNSITQAGEWQQYFPEADVANRGISGDNTQGMLARIDEIIAGKPKKFFILVGINDVSQSLTNAVILRNYSRIIERLQSQSPETEIFIQSVLPFNTIQFNRYARLKGKEAQVLSLNMGLRQLAASKKVEFINLFPIFADDNGSLRKEFTADGLHLNQEAYRLWANIIRSKVE